MNFKSDIFYDVIVGGGSVSGLLAARQVASNGYKVLVLEEDHEIGTPEHCGGVVSQKGLEKLGIVPRFKTVDNEIKHANIKSKNTSFQINSEKQKVIVIDRRAFDKELAFQAQSFGAEIYTKHSITDVSYSDNLFTVKVSSGKTFKSTIFIEARGVSQIVKRGYRDIIPSGQFEVYAPWIKKDTIEVEFDSELYPGFFAWIVPIGEGKGKVGVAGKNINPSLLLRNFLEKKGKPYSIIREIYAPLWTRGYISPFVNDRVVIIGDAAGQTKPTTAGGIYSGGMGGILAGNSVSSFLADNNSPMLNDYETKWINIFGKEFDRLLLFRKILERLDNKSIDKIFSNISDNVIEKISSEGDFDFHAVALKRFLNARVTINFLYALLGNEYRKIQQDLSKI
ncbi:MAG: NAD(P)/FAD-dependent oxidoreductase [Thermoproteota archaeon]|nr:NAD(P)/FAD-dependent oxidoreductase [Thermoproteota archaeon]